MIVKYPELSEEIIGCGLEVHRELGPGLLESAYEVCLGYELARKKINFQRQVDLPVVYKGVKLDCLYRIDFIIENKIILEIKSVKEIVPVHHAQILSYLRLTKLEVGLILNFNVPQLTNGIKRVVA